MTNAILVPTLNVTVNGRMTSVSFRNFRLISADYDTKYLQTFPFV